MAVSQKTFPEAFQTSAKKNTEKRPGEPYKDVLVFLEPREASLFKNKSSKVSAWIELNWLQMRIVLCIFCDGVSSKLIKADVLDHGWLNSISQLDMPYFWGVSNTKLIMSRTMAVI